MDVTLNSSLHVVTRLVVVMTVWRTQGPRGAGRAGGAEGDMNISCDSALESISVSCS